jgi:predicted nucleotidyltransferase
MAANEKTGLGITEIIGAKREQVLALTSGGGRLLMDLQTLLGREVDLVSEGDLHRLMRAAVIKEAVPL